MASARWKELTIVTLVYLTFLALRLTTDPASAGPLDPPAGYSKAFTCSACHGFGGNRRARAENQPRHHNRQRERDGGRPRPREQSEEDRERIVSDERRALAEHGVEHPAQGRSGCEHQQHCGPWPNRGRQANHGQNPF